MARLPRAQAVVHGVNGRATHASAVARFAARRAGHAGIVIGKVVLWLGVVTASIAAIGIFGSRSHPTYVDPMKEIERLRHSPHAKYVAYLRMLSWRSAQAIDPPTPMCVAVLEQRFCTVAPD
jgi:hypothetical protein